MLISAPFWCRYSTISKWPLSLAKMRAVHPSYMSNKKKWEDARPGTQGRHSVYLPPPVCQYLHRSGADTWQHPSGHTYWHTWELSLHTICQTKRSERMHGQAHRGDIADKQYQHEYIIYRSDNSPHSENWCWHQRLIVLWRLLYRPPRHSEQYSLASARQE